MQNLPVFLKLLRNKYFISVVVFVVWICFFDRNDLFTQRERKKELQKLETSTAYYEKEIQTTQKELSELQNNPAALEKFARENFYLKKPEEQVFIIDEKQAENFKTGQQ